MGGGVLSGNAKVLLVAGVEVVEIAVIEMSGSLELYTCARYQKRREKNQRTLFQNRDRVDYAASEHCRNIVFYAFKMGVFSAFSLSSLSLSII